MSAPPKGVQTEGFAGTPFYAAPEQFRKENDKVGKAADVFALGALLCEILTGCPPYQQQQDNPEDPALCDRIEALVMSDAVWPGLERLRILKADPEFKGHLALVQLAEKCLAPDLGARHPHAGHVAEQIRQHRESVEKRTRAAELTAARARVVLWLVVSVVFIVGLVGAGVIWRLYEKQERDSKVIELKAAVDSDLREVTSLIEGKDFQKANEILQRVVVLVNSFTGTRPPEYEEQLRKVQQQLEQVRKEQRFLTQAKEARLRLAAVGTKAQWDTEGAVRLLREALDGYGLNVEQVGEAVQLINASGIRDDLIAALDEISITAHATKDSRTEVLSKVANHADTNSWRRRLRMAIRDRTGTELRLLAIDPAALEQPPTYLVLLGNVLVSRGDREAVLNLLHAGLVRHPNDPLLRLSVGGVYMTTGLIRNQDIIACSMFAPAVRPEMLPAYIGLVGTICTPAPLQPEEALRHYTAAAALQPESAGIHVNLGITLYDLKRYEEAEAEFRIAAKFRPNSARIHLLLGNTFRARNMGRKAVEKYRLGIESEPEDADLRHNLGLVLQELGDFSASEIAYREAIARRPNYEDAWFGLGYVLDMQGKRADAIIEAYRKATNHAKALNNLGNQLEKQGDEVGAESAYLKALALEPAFAKAHANLGVLLNQNGRWDKAEIQHRMAIQIEPENAINHYNLGIVLRRQGKLEAAIQAYREAVRLEPTYFGALVNLAEAISRAEMLGLTYSLTEAVQHCLAAIAVRPDYTLAHLNLGQILIGQGQFNEGLKRLRVGRECAVNAQDLRLVDTADQMIVGAQRMVDCERRLLAVLQKKEKVVEAEENLSFAQACDFLHRWAAASEFFGEAFRLKPALRTTGNFRSAAATAATLAGFGKGEGGDNLSRDDRMRLRRQGLEWFRESLVGWEKLNTEDRLGRAIASQGLHVMRRDLASVRNDSLLNALSQAERREWLELWWRVDKVLRSLE